VLAGLHRGERDGGVHVIRRGDHHRVDVLLLQHLPEVVVPGRLRVGVLEPHAGRVGHRLALPWAEPPLERAFDVAESTSQIATMFSSSTWAMLLIPMPPMPTMAMLSFSLGAR
jgi:hypothetical protein